MPELLDLVDAVREAMKKAQHDLGRANLLIAGRTGVGKSTLINAIFQGRMAATGQGSPVTKMTRLISKEGIPLGIWDTRGLEMSDFGETLSELIRLVEERAREPEARDHIHAAWVCVLEEGRRVEAAEMDLCRALAQHMPVLAVITRACRDGGFRVEVCRLLPEAKNVCRVRAKDVKFDDGYSLPRMGLDDLVASTVEVLPEGIRDAVTAAAKRSWELKRKRAERLVGAFALKAAAAAATPVSFAAALMLVPIQISMLAGISVVFGLDASRDLLRVLVATATGTAGSTLAGRFIVSNLLKSIPGAGSVVGGTVSAATAGTLTMVLGEIYIASLVAAFSGADGKIPEMDAVEREFSRQIQQAKDDSLFEDFTSRAKELLGLRQ